MGDTSITVISCYVSNCAVQCPWISRTSEWLLFNTKNQQSFVMRWWWGPLCIGKTLLVGLLLC